MLFGLVLDPIVAEATGDDSTRGHAEWVVIEEPLDRHRDEIVKQSIHVAEFKICIHEANLDVECRSDDSVDSQTNDAFGEPFQAVLLASFSFSNL